jgi:hypothetical protein
MRPMHQPEPACVADTTGCRGSGIAGGDGGEASGSRVNIMRCTVETQTDISFRTWDMPEKAGPLYPCPNTLSSPFSSILSRSPFPTSQLPLQLHMPQADRNAYEVSGRGGRNALRWGGGAGGEGVFHDSRVLDGRSRAHLIVGDGERTSGVRHEELLIRSTASPNMSTVPALTQSCEPAASPGRPPLSRQFSALTDSEEGGERVAGVAVMSNELSRFRGLTQQVAGETEGGGDRLEDLSGLDGPPCLSSQASGNLF